MPRAFLVCVVLLAGCTQVAAAADDARARFFAGMQALCGARFEGKTTYMAEPSREFAGQLLVATVEGCEPDALRLPFAVGSDRSRTWLLRRTPAGLEFKHDHRQTDGTPDKLTMYGGLATGQGSARQQSFPADAETAALIPAAKTNVWTLSLGDEGQTLTYHLERDGKPRFTAVLKRVPPVAAQAPDFAANFAAALPLCKEWELPNAPGLAAGSSPEVRRNQLNAKLGALSRTYWWSEAGTGFLRAKAADGQQGAEAVCARLLLQLYR